MTEPESFEGNVLLLLAILLARTDDKATVTWDEVADAKRRLAENEPWLVAYPVDRLTFGDRMEAALRYKPKSRTAEPLPFIADGINAEEAEASATLDMTIDEVRAHRRALGSILTETLTAEAVRLEPGPPVIRDRPRGAR